MVYKDSDCVGLPDILLGKRNKIFIKLNIFFPTQSLDTSTSFSDVLEMKLVRHAARKPQAFMGCSAGVRWVQVLLALGRLQNPAAALGDRHPENGRLRGIFFSPIKP